MGGLVSRYAAQNLFSQVPGSIEGVATVDTPHQGANAAFNMPVLGGALLEKLGADQWAANGCFSQFDGWGCYLAGAEVLGGGYAQSIYANSPALIDLTPGSQALASLNSNPENFIKAAVVGYSPQRWLFSRVAWNWFLPLSLCPNPTQVCCPPDDFCGERTVATFTEIFYDVDVAVDSFLLWEIETYCEFNSGGGDCVVPPNLIEAYVQLLEIAMIMDATDGLFDYFVDIPGDGTSDGLVQGPSQLYPGNGALQYPVNGADSHSSALKSPLDHPVLDAVLAKSFHMQPLSSCAFSVPTGLNSPEAFSSSGGSSSFSVTTSSGCPWSAVSQNPWITITSGVNGLGGGTVAYSVAANNMTSARQGTIQVGNGNNSASYYISEAGPCAYSLSQNSIVAIPPSGGSATVTVNTQQNCVWSASSNVPWITISNSSGTGYGSFTWTAAANTSDTGRTGMITVGSQNLIIVDGNPAGTPGTATVTINGSPQPFTFNPCAPYRTCDQTVYETGSVSITVDGITFTQNYGGNMSANNIATSLANTMNYQYSPIKASVSAGSSTITIQSAVNGSDTDYPLSVSETFTQCVTYSGNYHCFSGPAFSPYTSQTQLNNGSD